MKKISLSLKIFFMAALCLIMASAIWNWTENQINFYLSRINSGLERMAQVQTSTNGVTRNHDGHLLWQDIRAGDLIYVGNSIQTDKNSSAEIILDEGEKIMIDPESLVRFVRVDDKISLDLIDGKIQVKGADIAIQQIMRLSQKKSNRLLIKTPRGPVALNDSILKLQASRNDAQNFKMEIVKDSTEPKIKSVQIEKPKPKSEPEPKLEPTPAPVTQKQPTQVPLVAPKVKSIKVKADQ